MQYCTRCLYPENHPYGLIFDEDGVCSGCRVHEEKDMFLNLIDDAMPLSEYIVQSLKMGLNISTVEGRTTFSLDAKKLIDNSYYILKDRKKSALIYFDADKQTINRVEKTAITGIKPRNAEQAFAIHSLLNDNVSLVSINGVAGTGKTLLALASAISQRRDYKQIFVARPIVPLSNKDIGYLPGDINSKINPYMEPLWDNFKYIQNQYQETSKEFKVLKNMIESEKLIIQPLAYIRGRSFSNIYFIIDEAQNLTPHEIKTIISRAGENTKIVFAGDINQIDTPYLDSQSNGLSYLIDKLKGQKLYSHVTLRKGERSELANLANDLL